MRRTFKIKPVVASDIPGGYLRTNKFNSNIRKDDQRNALEAFEIAVSSKYKQFQDFIDRQYYLTSGDGWSGTITEYEEGYYIELQGARSGFAAFVSGDSVVRKPNSRLLNKIGQYNINGASGTIHYMSTRH